MARSKVTDSALKAAARDADHLADLLTRVGLVACGGNYEIMRGRLESLGILDERFLPQGRRAQRFAPLPADSLVADATWDGARSTAEIIRTLHKQGYHASYAR